MRWSHVCPLLGLAMFACATEENDFPSPSSLTNGNDDAGGSAGVSGSRSGVGGGNSSGSNFGGSSSGTFGTSGTSASGSSTGGNFGVSGATSFGGTLGSAGNAGTNAGGKASSGAGGSAGAGGKANGGAGGSGGAGGKAGGGAGGKASGGAGGAGNTQCSGTIPAKSTWKGSALRATDPVTNAFDGDNATRFTTGADQQGDEWIEIDFGAPVTINRVTMLTPNNDYSHHYQLRLATTSKDFAAPILKEDDGMTGTITVTLPQTHSGRFLTIRQTGTATTWWSLYEVSVDCQ